MRFKDVFSIIGPSMIGPSSSHTAGAVRIGRVARKLAGALPEIAEIYLYGSFAETYHGHGTNLALVAGLLDFHTDDDRIKDSLTLARQSDMRVTFHPMQQSLPHVHPNTAKLVLQAGDKKYEVVGCSIGGGNIEIIKINQYNIKFSANYPTLLIFHNDRPGMIAMITHVLQQYHMNISHMKVERASRHGDVLTVIELDEWRNKEVLKHLLLVPDINEVHAIDLMEGDQQ
ncbi:L-serine ammonia-lyase, iron-sulfur-dependent subunit beta [Paenibacillus sp. FSL W7-1287]|uniref:L-serine ammonia-lyase, iron-sulfur-dependent subunit beta n=1 Tax=Paenibacillus sp. FSL W7-1287 TaxID=2954538 RepID=UPI0030FCA473